MNSDLWAVYEAIKGTDEENSALPREETFPVHSHGFKVVDIEMSSDSEEEDNDEEIDQLREQYRNAEMSGPIRSVHETPTSQLSPGEIPSEIGVACKVIPCCKVTSKVGNLCVCDPIPGSDPVAPGSLLVSETREPITRVIDLFGQIENPKIIINGDFEIGLVLYAALDDAVVVDERERDRIEKTFVGTDRSNCFDEPADAQDDSDDYDEDNE